MSNLFQKWRFFYSFLVLMTLSLHMALCKPRERRGARIPEHELQRRGSQSPDSLERQYCRDRLHHALREVCSAGAGQTPVYYSPDQLNIIAAQRQGLQGSTSKIRKNRRRRQGTRRNTRSNIVQECCHKPCAPAKLLKYCSLTIRNSTQLVGVYSSTSQSTSPLKVKTGRLSRNPNIHTLQDQPKCLGHPDCNTIPNEKQYVPKQSSSQCVSIADLQNFYFKLFQKKRNKDATQTDTSNNIINSSYGDPILKKESTNDYAIATNQMFPNNFPNPILKYDIDDWQPIMSSTTEEISASNEGDENDTENSTEPPTVQDPYNVVTAKPIIVIKFRPLTIDY